MWWARTEYEVSGPCKIGEQERVTFLSWCEQWLDEALREAEQGEEDAAPIFFISPLEQETP